MKTSRILASVLAFCAAATLASAREYFELRTYRLKSEEKAKLFDESFGPVIVEALGQEGVGPVGVFKARDQSADAGGEVLRFLLIPHKSIGAWDGLCEKLRKNKATMQKAAPFLSAEKSDPAYTRIESSLLLAFEGLPELKLPKPPVDKAGRHFEIRVYESHSMPKAVLKVEMFNKAELDIFAKTGLKPVFFGAAKFGPNLPNLTYMLVYDDDADREKAWGAFRSHPEWKTLKSNPRYADTVSKIHRYFLVATSYSKIQ